MRLFHFSEDPSIATFIPRPVVVPSQRAPGMEWLNGPLVWAIEERLDFLYLFPRDCPRIVIWSTEQTNDADKVRWLGEYRAAAYIERDRFTDLVTSKIYRYELPTESFEDLRDAGMWVSRMVIKPLRADSLFDLLSVFAPRGVDLRVVDSLLPLSLFGKHLCMSVGSGCVMQKGGYNVGLPLTGVCSTLRAGGIDYVIVVNKLLTVYQR